MDKCVRMKSRTAFSILHRFPGWWASAVMPLPLPSQIGRRSKWGPVKLVFQQDFWFHQIPTGNDAYETHFCGTFDGENDDQPLDRTGYLEIHDSEKHGNTFENACW